MNGVQITQKNHKAILTCDFIKITFAFFNLSLPHLVFIKRRTAQKPETNFTTMICIFKYQLLKYMYNLPVQNEKTNEEKGSKQSFYLSRE